MKFNLKENVMYKKLILATAVAAVAGQASAASWVSSNFGDQVAVIHTAEGIDKISDATGAPTSGAIISLGGALAQNDTIKFTYNGNKTTAYNWPTNLYSRKPGAQTYATTIKGTLVVSDNVVATVVVANSTDRSEDIAVGDICNFNGTTVDHRITANNTTTDTITFTPKIAAALAGTNTIICDNPSWVKLGIVNSDLNSVTYRVTSITGGASNVGSEIAVPTPTITTTSWKANKGVTVAYSAATAAGVAVDVFATTASLGTVIDEIKYVVTTKFDAVIDVENDKKVFSSNFVTGNTNADAVTITGTLTAGTEGDEHTIASTGVVTLADAVNDTMSGTRAAVTTVVGDVSYLDDAVAAGVTATGFTGTGADTFAVATTGASFTATDTAVTSGAIVLQLDNSEDVAMTAQSFTGSTVVTYTSGSDTAATKTVNHGSLGAWTLNGASVTAYAVPMGSAVTRFLWVNNSGATDAIVDYSITMNGNTYGPYALSTVPAKSSKSLGALVDADISNRSIYVAPNSRSNINFTAPVKANDITVSASYKHNADDDRLGLETSDTLSELDGK